MNVTHFTIEESKVSKGMMIMIAHAEDGKRYVVAGDATYSPKLEKYEQCWDAIGQKEYKKLTGR